MYKNKYLKYKNKYLQLKSQIGGDIIEDIKNGVKNDFRNLTLKEWFYEGIHNTDLKSINLPLFYLFDDKLNDNIGSSHETRDIILEELNINSLFDIDRNNIINISTASHATLFYIFSYNENNYLYYSNSGFGIDNNIMTGEYVFPKLFQINKDFPIKDKLENINKFINLFNSEGIYIIESFTKRFYSEGLAYIENLVKHLSSIVENKKNIDYIKDIALYILANRSYSLNQHTQSLIYALLYYLVSSNNDNLKECTFNNILNNSDPLDLFGRYLNLDLLQLFKNSITDVNKTISQNIYTDFVKSKNDDFEEKINEINKTLDEFGKRYSTINFMIKRLKIKYDDKIGICNLIQKSGSCTFYSYYLMATNMVLLHSDKKNISEYLNKIITFHYRIIYFFGICSNYNLFKLGVNDYFNHSYIYNLCDKYNLTNEMVEFYNNPGFILKLNNRSSYLLEGIIEETKDEEIKNILEKVDLDFIPIFKSKIGDIINDIRKNINISNDIIKQKFDDLQIYIDSIDTNIFNKIQEKPPSWYTKVENEGQIFKNNLYKYKELYYYYSLILKYSYNNIIETQYNPSDYYILVFLLEVTSETEKCKNRLLFLKTANDGCYSLKNSSIIHDIDNDIFLNFLNINEIVMFLKTSSLVYSKYKDPDFLEGILGLRQISETLYFAELKNPKFLNSNLLNIGNNADIIDISYSPRIIKNGGDYSFEFLYKYNKNFIVKFIRTLYISNHNSYLKLSFFKYCHILTNSTLILLPKYNASFQGVFFFNFFLHYMNINSNTIFFVYKNDDLKIDDTFYNIVKDFSIDDPKWENGYIYTQLTRKFFNYDNFFWINDLLEDEDKIDFNLLKSQKNDFNSFNYEGELYTKYLVKKDNRGIINILGRIGISINDLIEFMILFNPNKNKMIIFTKDSFECLPKKFFIFNINRSKKINKDECYMISNKEKYKLIFDIDSNKFPFIVFFPKNSIYLCYEDKNNIYIDIIVNLNFNSNGEKNYDNILSEKKIELKKKKSFIESYKIAPSLALPLSKNFNKDNYKDILEFYYGHYIMQNPNLYKNSLIESYSSDLINEKLSVIINDLIIQTKKKISINETAYNSCNAIIMGGNNVKQDFIEHFKDEYRFCNISPDSMIDIKDYIQKIDIILSQIILKQNNNYKSFIIENLSNLLLIKCCNSLKTIMNQLNALNQSSINCEEFQPILVSLNSIDNFRTEINQDKYYVYELLFLLQVDYFLNKFQLKKYREIRDDISNPELKLHQFMMAKGKTSVFTPLLSYSIKLLYNKQPTVITASHLVKDTNNIVSLNAYLYDMNVNVFSDFQAKKRWILKKNNSGNINLENEYNIIDEFDSHHNYLQSMFNYVLKEKKSISESQFKFIFKYINKKNSNNSKNPITKYLQFYERQAENMIFNINYGFDKDNKNVLCIPFLRRDTPVKNSNFSSILLRLILTFKAYIKEFNLKLQESDYTRIYNNIPYLYLLGGIDADLDNYINTVQDNEDLFTLESIKNIFETIYTKPDNETIKYNIKYNIIVKYLYNINVDSLKYSEEQLNVSFQDIIYNNYSQWQVGYTGTVSLTLNTYDSKEEYLFRSIIPDHDEKIEVLLALKSTKDHMPNIVKKINSNKINSNLIQDILDFFTENSHKGSSRGLIDLYGLFKDIDNYDLSKQILEKFTDKKIIYFHNDVSYQLENGKDPKLFDEILGDNNFYYFDQGHTVGSDLKQPQTGSVIVLINEKSKYTDFAQGIFRFRKLNKGTYLSIIIDSDKEIEYTIDNVLELLNANETKFNDNQKEGLKFQLFKTMIRKITKDYKETDLQPDFMRGQINKKVLEDILNNNIIKNYNNYENSSKSFVEELINYFKNNDTITRKLIFGYNSLSNSANDQFLSIETEAEAEAEAEADADADAEAEAESIISNKDDGQNKFNITVPYLIYHSKCLYCKYLTCTKLFKTNIKINSKDIYISYNLLMFKKAYFSDMLNYMSNIKLLNYVEFDDYFLIELEDICTRYYSNLLPVYNLYGKLKNNIIYNRGDSTKEIELPPLLVRIIGLQYNIKEEYKLSEDELNNNLTNNGKRLLCFYFYGYLFNLKECMRNQSKIYRLQPIFRDYILPTIYNTHFKIISEMKNNIHHSSNLLNMYNYDKRDKSKEFYISDPISNPNILKYIEPEKSIFELIRNIEGDEVDDSDYIILPQSCTKNN
jgi:hypothetical protein